MSSLTVQLCVKARAIAKRPKSSSRGSRGAPRLTPALWQGITRRIVRSSYVSQSYGWVLAAQHAAVEAKQPYDLTRQTAGHDELGHARVLGSDEHNDPTCCGENWAKSGPGGSLSLLLPGVVCVTPTARPRLGPPHFTRVLLSCWAKH
jgi:hypothetical protein